MAGSYIRQLADAIRAKTPDGEGDDLLYLMYAVLARVKGVEVNQSDVHDVWSAVAEYAGTTSGDLIPFDQLPSDVRNRDTPFVEAIHVAVLEMRSRDNS